MSGYNPSIFVCSTLGMRLLLYAEKMRENANINHREKAYGRGYILHNVNFFIRTDDVVHLHMCHSVFSGGERER